MRPGLLRLFLESHQPEVLRRDCLEQIRLHESRVRAWVEVVPQPPLASGSLDGVPFGVKDIFDTKELRTQYGSPLFAGRRSDGEAGLVTALRQRGAILLGKTQTTAMAYYDPPPTRNPLNLKHTPGGSSSGSAAAVAAGMVPFALGTQTQGSVLRPASYCGICGFKPTYGLLPRDGILPFAPSLDTPGLFTQTADDMQLLWQRMGNAIPDTVPRRLGSLQRRIDGIRGWQVDHIDLPLNLDGVLEWVRTINAYEGARTHRDLWLRHGDRIGSKLSLLVADGLKIPEGRYREALTCLAFARATIAEVYKEYPILISDAATGPAPEGLASTGDPKRNAPWTGLHGPAVSVPVPGEGLPVGLQLTAAAGNDSLLLEIARLVESAL